MGAVHARLRDDRGSFTVMIAILAMFMVFMILLTLDAGKRLNSLSHAQDLAGETARFAAQVLERESVLSSGPRIDGTRVASQTEAWAHARGGKNVLVSVAADGQSVTVTLTVEGQVAITPDYATSATATHTATVLDGS